MKRKRILSKIAAIFIIAAMLVQMLPVVVYAATGYDDDLNVYYYTVDGEGNATITGFTLSGESTGDVVIPDIFNEHTVTQIGVYAFMDKGLTSVAIPDTVTSILMGAFWTNELTSITLGSNIESIGHYAFSDNKLISVIIPDSVTSIGSEAFTNNLLTNVTLGSGIISILNYTFANNQLTSLTIPNNITTIGASAFDSNNLTSVTIPSSVTHIYDEAFANNQLTDVTIENSMTSIFPDAFSNNQVTPANLTIHAPDPSYAKDYATTNGHTFADLDSGGEAPDGVDTDGDGNIYNYTDNGDGTATITSFTSGGSTDIVIPSEVDGLDVTGIGNGVFRQKGLTSVVIPEGVIEIGDTAFYSSRSDNLPNKLGSVTIPASVKNIGNYAFNGQGYLDYNGSDYISIKTLKSVVFESGSQLESIGRNAFSDNGIESLTLPDSVATIGDAAFSGNKLTSITIPTKVTHIGEGTFSTNNLNSIIIPESVVTIGDYAFPWNELTSVTIPESVVSIGIYAFGSNRLTSVTIKNSEATIGNSEEEGAFADNQATAAALTIHGYTSSTAETYATANGHTFAALSGGGGGEAPVEVYTDGDGNIYTYTIENDAATITDIELNGSADIQIPDTLNGYPVKRLGNSAFYGKEIKSVNIPDGVTHIGDSAFANNMIRFLRIPQSVQSIGTSAFEDNSLYTVKLLNASLDIGNDAFFYNALDRWGNSVPEYLKVYGYTGSTAMNYADNNEHTFVPLDPAGGGSATINGNTYIYTDNDDEVSVTITDCADDGQTGLVIPATINGKTVTGIGNGAFKGKAISGELIIPEGVTNIGDEAFIGTDDDNRWMPTNRITKVTIPASVVSIGEYAFFAHQYWDEERNTYINSLTEVIFSGGEFSQLESIGDYAFQYNALVSVEIPQNVTRIGNSAFKYQYDNDDDEEWTLTTATILGRETVISDGAFASNRYLTLKGYAGSTAEEYADDNDYTFEALDDDDTEFAGGIGSEENPFLIQTPKHLNNVRNYMGFLHADKHFKLIGDIDLNVAPYNQGQGWEPIGQYYPGQPFFGTFDGNGFKITGLFINRPESDYVGLFGYVEYGTIKNLTLKDVNVTGGSWGVGGLMGKNAGGTIIDSSSEGAVTGDAAVGGLVGQNDYFMADIARSYASGTVVGNESVGGLVGWNYGTITDSHAMGTVMGFARVGGLVGYMADSSIINSYAAGAVSGSTNVGGLVGEINPYASIGTISNSYYNKETTSQEDGVGDGDSTGVTGFATAEMKSQASFTGWDFTSTWAIVNTPTHHSYPYLRATQWIIADNTLAPGYSMKSPEAQPTNLIFSSKAGNIILSFTSSDTADGYLIVRKIGSAPTFVPVNGTIYSTDAQGGDLIVAVGNETSYTESSATVDTDYFYAIYAYKESGTDISYLTTNPLSGQSQLKSGSKIENHLIYSTDNATSVGGPDAGVTLTFPEGLVQNTTITIEKVTSEPPSNFLVQPNVRRVNPLYFNVTATPNNPGNYTIVLDFSSLNLSESQWNNFVILKRDNDTSPWKDVVADLGATIISRQTDGVWGKFTISGLDSFSQFAGGIAAVTHTVTSGANDGAGSLRQVLSTAIEGDIITFNVSGNTITLTAPLIIDKDITIRGNGETALDGGNVTRVLTINEGKSVRLENLKLQNGSDPDNIVGGILNDGQLTLVNSLVVGNKATGIGADNLGGVGGILQESFSDPKLILINSTVTGNEGAPIEEEAGGVGGLGIFTGAVEIYNSIVYGNTGEDPDAYFQIPIVSYNSLYGFAEDAFTITEGTGNLFETKPLFINTGDHPYLLGSDSPAIDAGDNSFTSQDYDIRGSGFARIVKVTESPTATVDIGAYEVQIYTVTYNSNGSTDGTVPTDSNSYQQGDTVMVLGNTGNLTKTGYAFAGWNTAANGNGTNYTVDSSFTMGSSNVMLYAKWTAVNTGSKSSGSTTQTPPSNNVAVTVDGQTQQQAATVATKTMDGRTVAIVTLDTKKIAEIVNSSQTGSSVTIPLENTKQDVAVGELNGELVKAMENKQVVVEIKTDVATYTLPAKQINIDAVSAQLGQDVKLSNIKVSIEIAKVSGELVKIVETSAKKGNFSIVAPPIEFTVKATYSDKTVEVKKFNAYVERSIAIPEGVDPTKITTAIIVDSDGTVRHVPTKVIVINGKYYAQINSLTNSTYSVIWNPLEFKDVQDHWAKEAVNDMGARMVISGVGNDMFDPDRDITRAEFAAIIVRALGLKPGTGKIPFTDVKGTDWYSSYVITAAEYKIISGYGDGKFGPNDKITREQAMTIVARAMNITDLKVQFANGEMDKLLAGFGDSAESADYAKNSIAACIKTGIVSGRSGSLIAPKDNITRAEVAVIVRKLLQKSGLI